MSFTVSWTLACKRDYVQLTRLSTFSLDHRLPLRLGHEGAKCPRVCTVLVTFYASRLLTALPRFTDTWTTCTSTLPTLPRSTREATTTCVSSLLCVAPLPLTLDTCADPLRPDRGLLDRHARGVQGRVRLPQRLVLDQRPRRRAPRRHQERIHQGIDTYAVRFSPARAYRSFRSSGACRTSSFSVFSLQIAMQLRIRYRMYRE